MFTYLAASIFVHSPGDNVNSSTVTKLFDILLLLANCACFALLALFLWLSISKSQGRRLRRVDDGEDVDVPLLGCEEESHLFRNAARNRTNTFNGA